MSTVSASAVKAFRERTGLPLMDCKKALQAAGGDQDKAIELLRKEGQKLADKRADRETAFGRFGQCLGLDRTACAMVELLCESAPVTQNDEFIQLANDLATALANSQGVSTADELLDLDSPSKPGTTLRTQKEDLFNRIREVFNVGRMIRVAGSCGGYTHNAGTVAGVLLHVEGGTDEAAKDISMHIAAMKPAALSADDLDQEMIDKERQILRAAALAEGKPENIVDKMVDGRMRSFFAERTLLQQPFVKDDKQTVEQYAKSAAMVVKSYHHWILGEK